MKVLKESFQSLLRDVDAEHFCTTSDTTLDDFFVAIKDQPGFSLKMEDTSFAIKLSNMENEISCPIDSYLKFLIASGKDSDINVYDLDSLQKINTCKGEKKSLFNRLTVTSFPIFGKNGRPSNGSLCSEASSK